MVIHPENRWSCCTEAPGAGRNTFRSCHPCSGDTNNILVVSPGDNRADRFVAALKTIGYGASEGSALLVDPANLVNYHVIDSAAGNNAGQPYKRLQVPPFPNTTEEQNEKTLGVFRLQPYEAIVYVGTPSGT